MTAAAAPTPTGVRWPTVALVMVASMVAQSFGRFAFPVVVPDVQADLLDDSAARAGFLGTMNLVAYLVGTAATAVVAPRTSPGNIVRTGLTLSTIGLAVIGLANGFVMLLVGLLLTGVGGAAIWIPSPVIAASAAPPERRGLVIGVVGSFIALGIGLNGPLAAGVEAAFGDGEWRPVYAVLFGVAATTLVAVLARLGAAERSPEPDDGRPPARLSSLREVPGWRGLAVAYAAYGLAYPLYLFFLVSSLEDDHGLRGGVPGAVVLTIGIIGVAGGVVIGRISDTVGRPLGLAAVLGLMGTAALLTLTGNVVLIFVSAAMFGLAFAGGPSAISAHIADHLSERSFSAAFGAVTFLFGLAQIAGPQIGGFIGDHADSFALSYVLSAGAAAVGVAAALSMRRT